MNLMLANDFFRELLEWLKRWPVIVSLVLLVVAITLAVLSRRIARVVRKSNDVEKDDKIVLGIKVLSIVLLFMSFLMMVFM